MSLKEIDAKIATFTTNRAALANLAHEIGMMVFDHAKAHGDCTRGLKLCQELPKSWKSQMETWFKTFSPIRIVTINGKEGLDPRYKALKDQELKDAYWRREEANETPFHMLEEPDPDAKTYDLEALMKMVAGLAKRIEKAADNGDVKADDIDTAKALARAVAGLKVERVKPSNDGNIIVQEVPITAASAMRTVTVPESVAA